ncbi:MAG: hypothetical protein HKN36_03575 [Hellea sp.]|nr:hypothetical protein [Hellea sp.]
MSSKDQKLSNIEDIRVEIDRVDNLLLELIAKRMELAGQVRKVKSGVRLWRPSREHSLVKDLAEASDGTPANLVARIWAELMSASCALQGTMKLHVSLEGDALKNWSLVRDRFGAALPTKSYPTTSAALAAAYAEEEGVAVIPAPGGMQRWWTSLCKGGAMEDMHILTGLPRVEESDWPVAVAVATADILPSGDDMTLIALKQPKAALDAGLNVKLRAESGEFALLSVDEFLSPGGAEIEALQVLDPSAKIIGAIARALPEIG